MLRKINKKYWLFQIFEFIAILHSSRGFPNYQFCHLYIVFGTAVYRHNRYGFLCPKTLSFMKLNGESIFETFEADK